MTKLTNKKKTKMSVAYGGFSHGAPKATINKDEAVVTNSQIIETAGNQTIINIHIACKNLPKMDIASESDPMVVLSIPINGRYEEVARTEVIWNNPNPEFVKFLQAAYIFEMQQPLRFSIYDVDSENAKLSDHDFIGYVDTDVQTLARNIGASVELSVRGKKTSSSKIILTPEPLAVSNDIVKMKIEAKKMKKMRTFSKNCPFVLISKVSEAGKPLPIYRSEVIPKCYQCSWNQFELPLQNLCNGDIDLPIQITLMDNHINHPDKPIGSCSMSLRNFMETIGTFHEAKNEKGKVTGQFAFRDLQIYKKPTFLDYLRSGIQLNLITAVDFTASNRQQTDPQSLHYLSDRMNQYECCISSVGGVVCPYDSDQLFPVFGFGGKVNGQLSHCFPLTFDFNNPCVQGLNGILHAYRSSLQRVQLSGPTFFAPVIKAADDLARESFATSRTYTILMILTDGIINDFRETADAIVHASDSPLSIIIVGVGPADFSAMVQLDGDETPLTDQYGHRTKRDIVQFVPFRKFQNQPLPALAAEVLAEIPTQVHEFCVSHNYIVNL